MIKKFFIALALVCAVNTNCRADQLVSPEIPTAVKLSNMDINRIVCPGPMNDLIFSREKGMTGHFSGNNAFIKFKIEDIGEELIYADTQSELFIVCDNTVYSLLVTPAEIPSVTLRLAAPKGDSFRKNISHYQNLPLEKQALQLIREAYANTWPENYRIVSSTEIIPLSPELETRLVQTIEVDGVGLRLKKFQVTSLAKERIDLDEKIFLAAGIDPAILAVAVEEHGLEQNQTTRVFVVGRKEKSE